MALFTRGTRTGVLRGKQGAVKAQAYLRGGPELARALASLEKGVRDDLLKQATKAGGDVLADAWRERVKSTIGTGPGTAHYAEAIEATSRAGKRGATAIVGLKRSVPLSAGESHPREYASRLEFGSGRATRATLSAGRSDFGRGRAAQPTLRPAFDAVDDQMLDAMSDEIRRLIEKAV